MGAGEYVVSKGTDTEPLGHFALAARDYTHSTAPNRRFADLVNQRLVKAMLDNQPSPYTDAELADIAMHCNLQESAGQKVERAMRKRAAAVALSGSIGKVFQGVITGASEKGVYVRVFSPPVEGRVDSRRTRPGSRRYRDRNPAPHRPATSLHRLRNRVRSCPHHNTSAALSVRWGSSQQQGSPKGRIPWIAPTSFRPRSCIRVQWE